LGSKIDILEEYIRPRGIRDELIYIDGGCGSGAVRKDADCKCRPSGGSEASVIRNGPKLLPAHF
jgi:hypothetical protein